MSDDSSSVPPSSDGSSPDKGSPSGSAPIRARPWKRPPSDSSPPGRPRPYRLGLRLIGIPAAAIAGVFLYQGLRAHFFLPECDSEAAKHTLADVLKQYGLQPTSYAPIKTVSSGKEEIACNAVLPLPDGGKVAIDYTFYWQGSTAGMRYSVTPHVSPAAPATPSPPTR
jgi:hypothetical protein